MARSFQGISGTVPARSSNASNITPALVIGIAIVGAVIPLLVPSRYVEAAWSSVSSIFITPDRIDPTDYAKRAQQILKTTPLIDGHNDFPFLLRQQLKGKIYDHDFLDERLSCHSDFQKMKQGMMGGQFWSVYVPCPEDLVPGVDLHDPNKRVPDLNEPNWAVRDTLEQIDITKRLVTQYPDIFTLCTTPTAARKAFANGRIASMIGIEGGHQVGNSLGALRLLFEAGARYMTMTHNCDNPFATCHLSWNQKTGQDAGLTEFGVHAVHEMNRLGMMVDLSHVSPQTMRDVLHTTKAPVIFSHSGCWSLNQHSRNVPDDVLRLVKENGGVVMIPAVAPFMNAANPDEADIEDVVDQILHVVKVAGWENVGVGSDFDGSTMVVKGFEDTSKYPNLITRLLARADANVTDAQARLVAGENLLRVWDDVERVAAQAAKTGKLPSEEVWEGRVWEAENFDVPRMFA